MERGLNARPASAPDERTEEASALGALMGMVEDRPATADAGDEAEAVRAAVRQAGRP